MTTDICLYDHDTKHSAAALADLASVLQRSVNEIFGLPAPLGYGCSVRVHTITDVQQAARGAWLLGLWLHPDTPGALGYHDTTPEGRPALHVFPALDTEENLSVTATHEVFEALADPSCLLAVPGPDGVIRAYEPGDPVEAQWFDVTARSGAVKRCSDFVLPAYFTGLPGPKNHVGNVTGVGQILGGGYQIVFDPSIAQWTQITAGSKREHRMQRTQAGHSRLARRQNATALVRGVGSLRMIP